MVKIFPHSIRTAQEDEDILGDAFRDVMEQPAAEEEYLYAHVIGDGRFFRLFEKGSSGQGVELEYRGGGKSRFYRVHKSQLPKLSVDEEDRFFISVPDGPLKRKFPLMPLKKDDPLFAVYSNLPWVKVS